MQETGDMGSIPGLGRSVREGNGNPLQYSCLGNPMGRGALQAAVHGVEKESDTTEQLHFHFSLSCVGEGNGNPLQCSCLEDPRDGGAWWAAATKSLESCLTLCDPIDSSPPGSPVPGILQARTLEWVAISFFNA